jgi:carboxyl-terminal processing protease
VREAVLGRQTPYAEALLETTAELGRCLADCREAWRSVDPNASDGREDAARRLRRPAERLDETLTDLDAMTARRPWSHALVHARVAREIVSDRARMRQSAWYRRMIEVAEQRLKELVAEEDWYDALSVYARLKELEPANEAYREGLKTARRRVRVLGLFDDDGDANGSANGEAPRWQEIGAGVDMDMVRSAICQLDDYYVDALDYRQLIRGALRGVRALTECPKAREAFPHLGDRRKRERFQAVVSRELETANKKDRVDHMSLLLALTSVARASEDTVQIPTSVIVMQFTDGFLDELDDFSVMVWPYDLDEFTKRTMGSFCGVGIQITKENGQPLEVVSPLPDSPALRAGVKTGDLIVAVDGQRTAGLSLDKLVRMITGKKGTWVGLRVQRPGQRKSLDFRIRRDEISVRTVKGWRRVPGGDGGRWAYLVDPEHKIGYVRVTNFYRETHEHLVAALKGLRRRGARSLVLDLRANPGGLLQSAKAVANEFLRAGRIVATRGRQRREQVHEADGHGEFLDGNLVVLVNQFSASAAEIVAGAVRDLKRGPIVGRRTYGKGSVQHVVPIPRHRARLKLTAAYYYLPSGRCLHRRNGAEVWGVDPSLEVVLTPEQTRRWLEVRRETDRLQEVDPARLDADLDRQYEADLQLQTAVVMLRLMQIRDGAG